MANTSLPFEVIDDKGKNKASMKRVALLVRPEKVDAIVAAIRGRLIEAIIYDVKSAGKERDRYQWKGHGHLRFSVH